MYMKRLRACTNQAQMRSHATDPRKSNSELYRTLHLESTTRNIHCVLTQRRKGVLRDFLHELRKLPWGQQKRQEHFFFSFPSTPSLRRPRKHTTLFSNALCILTSIMCLSCTGWPFAQPVHLAAPPVKEEHVFLDSSYDFYPDYRTVSEESYLPTQSGYRSGTTCLLVILTPSFLLPIPPSITTSKQLVSLEARCHHE